MEFNADLKLTNNQLKEFFEKLAENLDSTESLLLPLGKTNVSLRVGSAHVFTKIKILEDEGKNSLSLTFDWIETSDEEEPISHVVESKAESAKIVDMQATDEEISEFVEVAASGKSLLIKRKEIDTTTFGYDVGAYYSAFSQLERSHWDLVIDKDAQLANVKWGASEEVTVGIPLIEDIEKKPEEDSYQETEASQNNSRKYMTEGPKKPAPDAPIPAPTATKIIKKKAEIKDTNNLEWSEPRVEDNITDDDWIKPSDLLKRKQKGQVAKPDFKEKNIEEKSGIKPSKAREFAEKSEPEVKKPPTAPEAPDHKKKKKGWAKWD
jgi:hypothetical protein